MDEIIVRLARAIASRPRLRLLSLLARRESLPPTRLAAELRLPLNVVSLHLRALVTAGLISRRKSGTWCHYRAESPYDETTVSGSCMTWLREILPFPERLLESLGLHEARQNVNGPEVELHRLVFEAATAFTDLRRIQILRYLSQKGRAAGLQLEESLGMSPQALSRHMRKLARRGYVRTRRQGRVVHYELSPTDKTAVHARMFAIVRSTWDKKQFRTS